MLHLASIVLAIAAFTCTPPAHTVDLDLTPGSGSGASGGALASPFKQAVQRFQHEVAASYGKRAAEPKIIPPSEDVVGIDDQNLADLIAFYATSGELQVRGLASPTTAVLARRDDYGPLFRAARVLDAAASMSAERWPHAWCG